MEFSGRFVFEQMAPGAAAVDGCYQLALNEFGFVPYDPFKGVTGDGWFVNSTGVWGSGHMLDGTTNLLNSDDIGMNSDKVTWYSQSVGQCSITLYQTMFMDSVSGPASYNSGGSYGSTNQLKIVIDNSLGSPLYCTGVIPSGSSLASTCKEYPPQ